MGISLKGRQKPFHVIHRHIGTVAGRSNGQWRLHDRKGGGNSCQRPLKARHRIAHNGVAQRAIRLKVSVGADNNFSALRPQAIEDVVHKRPSLKRDEPFVAAAHAGGGAPRKNDRGYVLGAQRPERTLCTLPSFVDYFAFISYHRCSRMH